MMLILRSFGISESAEKPSMLPMPKFAQWRLTLFMTARKNQHKSYQLSAYYDLDYGIERLYCHGQCQRSVGNNGFACAPSLSLVAPTGGTEKLLGNSPNSLAFPAGHTCPAMMMDMASTMVAGGKIQMAIRKGEQVPLGWILNAKGEDTQDPLEFEDRETGKILGSLLPMAGPKGYCIIVMIELLASILSGAKTGPNLVGGGRGIGFFMAAIDPEIIRPLDELKTDLDAYYTMIKHSKKKEGVQEIFLPGEIEHNNTQKRLKEGLELNGVVAEELLKLMVKYNKLPKDAEVKDVFKKA